MFTMMSWVIFLIFLFRSSSTFNCDETWKCDESLTMQELHDLKFTPNREQLLNLCPKALEFFHCYFLEEQKCNVPSIPELAASGHKLASDMLRTKNLVKDICNEDSSLHKDYLASHECIRDIIRAESPVCKDNTQNIVKVFLKSRSSPYTGKEEETPVHSDEQHYLETVYTLACLAEDLHKNCGEIARRVYTTVLQHSKGVVIEFPAEVDVYLKREFLDYLDLKEEEKSSYFSIFEIFR